MLPNFAYVRANSLKEAVGSLGEQGARVCSGGTDLLGCLRDEVFSAGKLVNITGLKALSGIANKGDVVRIGALTTITELADNDLVRQNLPGLAQAAGSVGSPQLRNQGTIGGNICQKPRCWYYRGEFHCLRKGGAMCYALGGENQFHGIFGSDNICCIVHPSDPSPMLLALGAQVNIVGPSGSRVVPFEGFHVLPKDNVERETILKQGEIVTELLVPSAPKGLYTSYRKIRARRSWDFALAGVALALVMDNDVVRKANVALSGAAPVPWRAVETEKVLNGKRLTPEIIEQAGLAAVKGAQPLKDNGYKIPLFRAAMEEELTKAAKASQKK